MTEPSKFYSLTMNMVREIDKKIDPPTRLSREAIRLISDLCFVHEQFEPGHFDAIFVFGTPHKINQEQIASLFPIIWHIHNPHVVYLTGGVTLAGLVESEEILRLINPGRYPKIDFRTERHSTNTKENVEQALELGLADHHNILFIAKSPHCGRCQLTLAKYLPSTKIKSRGYDPFLPDGNVQVRKDNWHEFPEICRLMWGEFLRIERYGKRGDIAYSQEIQAKVERIHSLTNA